MTSQLRMYTINRGIRHSSEGVDFGTLRRNTAIFFWRDYAEAESPLLGQPRRAPTSFPLRGLTFKLSGPASRGPLSG